MEYGLKYITFYVRKHITPLGISYNPHLVRDKPLGAPHLRRLLHPLQSVE